MLENLFSSMSALTSLVGLLDKVKNMVISDEIQHLVSFHNGCLLLPTVSFLNYTV